MPYTKKTAMTRRFPRRTRRPLFGFGDFSDETPCSQIPAGDAYRKPGNYCATSDGGYTTFNADGSTYSDPSSGSGSSSSPGSMLDKIGSVITGAFGQRPVMMPGVPVLPQTGMSTTTKVALAGGAVLLVVLLTRR